MNSLPRDGARFALPDDREHDVNEQEQEHARERCRCCDAELKPRHREDLCDFCADLLPWRERERVRRINAVPPTDGAHGRLERLGARRMRFNLWIVPGVPELLSALEALATFGPDEMPAKLP